MSTFKDAWDHGYADAMNPALSTADIPDELWFDTEYVNGYAEGMKFYMPH